MKKGRSSAFYVYFLVLGAGVGMASLWRLPFVSTVNGGGSFFILYVILLFLLGVPLWMGEFLLGKRSKKSLYLAIKDQLREERRTVGKQKSSLAIHAFIGFAFVFLLFFLAYFSVVSGWILHFSVRLFISLLTSGVLQAKESLEFLMNNGWLQVLLTSAHMLLIMLLVHRNNEESGGLLWVKRLIPIFFILLLFLALRSFSFPGRWEDAYRHFFYPDFSRFRGSTLIYAVGQALITLGVGFGLTTTIGQHYMTNKVPRLGVILGGAGVVLSVIIGAFIFPLVFHRVGLETLGPDLIFRSVPELFTRIGSGAGYGFLFFLCLYIGALTVSVGLLMTTTNFICDWKKIDKSHSLFLVGLSGFALSLFPSFASNLFQESLIFGMNYLVAFDFLIFNILLPISSLLLSYILLKSFKYGGVVEEFGPPSDKLTVKLYRQWIVMLRFVVPFVIVLALVSAFYDKLP